jgi:hypothetical protein
LPPSAAHGVSSEGKFSYGVLGQLTRERDACGLAWDLENERLYAVGGARAALPRRGAPRPAARRRSQAAAAGTRLWTPSRRWFRTRASGTGCRSPWAAARWRWIGARTHARRPGSAAWLGLTARRRSLCYSGVGSTGDELIVGVRLTAGRCRSRAAPAHACPHASQPGDAARSTAAASATPSVSHSAWRRL